MNAIVGVWQLVESRAHDDKGAPLPPSYGPNFMGVVQLNAEGRMMCVLSDGRAEVSGGKPREYVSYGGTYRFDGKTLVTRVDMTSDAPRMGGDEVRQVRFEGDLLVLTPPPRSRDGVMQHRELVWRRIAAG